MTDTKWKDIGEHLSQTLTNFEQEEEILFAEIVDQFEGVTYFAATQQGQIKRFERKELSPWRTYRSKSTKYAKLKDQDDRIVAVAPVVLEDIMIITQNGYGLRFNIEEVPVVGAKAAGSKRLTSKTEIKLLPPLSLTTLKHVHSDSTRQSQTDATRRYSCDQSG